MRTKKTILLISILVISFLYAYLMERDNVIESMSKNIKPTLETKSYISPYTGEEVDSNTFNNIPFMAIIENSKDARPQSGLSSADLVYETMAEGEIPRFIVLFQKIVLVK